MPKIEKDLLKVKGSDGQWHYVPAVGGEGGSTPTWDAVQNKPFESIGDGLLVENGVLSAKGGGGSANAVQYVAQSLTDEQKTQARENIGAGTSSFSGSYNDLTSKPTIPTQVTIDSTLKQSGQAADAKAVGDALAEKADTTDIPNVPAWAMADEKPTYTAAEVHALPDTTVIPPAYTLPQATADALGGIKADAATAEDTQPVRIGADGKMKTKPYTLTDADKTAVAEEVVADGIAATLTDMPSGGGGGAYKLLYSTTLEQAAVVSVDMTEEAAACGEYIFNLAIPSGDTAVSYTSNTKIAGSNACATNVTTVSNVYGTLQLINAKKTDDQKNLIEICFVNTASTTPTLDTAGRTNWSVKRITVSPITYADVLFDSAIELPAGTIIRIGGK